MVCILGCENVEVDKELCIFRRCIEWCLKKIFFIKVCVKFSVILNIDLFVFRINY